MKVTVILEKQARVYVDLPEDKAVEAFSNIADTMLSTLEKVSVNDISTVKREKRLYINSEPTQNENKTFIMTRCPKCGNLIIGNLTVGQAVKCKNCGEVIEIKDPVPGKYQCPNCGWTSAFSVVGDLKATECKSCGSEIDLIYHDKKQMYLSANLIDRSDV